MDRKIIYIGGGAVLLLVLVFVVIAVLSGNKKTEPKTTTLTIWDSFDSEDDLKEIINSFEQQNKDVEVKFVKKNPTNYETESINAIAAGQGPDVWVIPNTWTPKHHNKLAPLPDKTLDPKKKKSNDEIYKNTFLPAAYQDNVIEGQVYGMPLFVDSLALFYNNRFFVEKLTEYRNNHPDKNIDDIRNILTSAPQTWEDLAEIIKYFGQDVVALGDSTTVEKESDILAVLMIQKGAQMTSDDKKTALFQTSANLFNETPYPGTKALEFYTSFARKDDPHYTWPGNKNSFEAFVKGEVGMIIDYSRKAKDIPTENNFTYDVKPLPQLKDTKNSLNLASYYTFTAPRSSPDNQAAWDFITTLTNQQLQGRYLTQTGLGTPTKEAIGAYNPRTEQNKYSVSWYNPDPAKVDEIFKSAITQTLNGDNPQTVLEGAAAQVTNLLTNLKNQ